MNQLTLEVFESGDGWRWRCRAANGRLQFTAGEAFASRSNAVRAARRVAALLTHETEVTVEI